MTIQLEFQFHSFLPVDAAVSLYYFSSYSSALDKKLRNLPRYIELQKEAQDLANYAHLNGHINFDQYAELQKIIFKSSDLFWS